MAPELIWKWGHNTFSVVPLHFFGSTNTINRFGERFREMLNERKLLLTYLTIGLV